MADFSRSASDDLLQALRNEDLYSKKLLPDIRNGKIFPAVRKGYLSFYYAKGSLFKYTSEGFFTHIKYAFVPEGNDGIYITQGKLRSIKPIADFESGYEKIKERCEHYSGIEDDGVATLFKFSAVRENPSRYSLVDIEITFSGESAEENYTGRKNDRIDILLYDNDEKSLLFCEAKDFSNKELWSKEGTVPKVTKQLDRYNDQIVNNKDAILEQYATHFKILNTLFDSKLNKPKYVYEKCGLLLFGYDSLQKDKINKLLVDDGSLNDHKSYYIGNISAINIEELYKTISR